MDNLYEPIDELDALISAALSDEPMLKVPASLQRGVEERLRIVHLREREKARFSASMTTLAIVFLASIAVAGTMLWFTSFSFLYTDGVSGGKGHLDYYFTALPMYFSGYQGSYTLFMSFVLGIGAFIAAIVMQLRKARFTD
jgi:hypothetical protein